MLTLALLSLVMVGGPIQVNIVASLKDILLTYAGFAFFNDSECTTLMLSGLAISFVGVCYALQTKLKLVAQEKQSEKTALGKND